MEAQIYQKKREITEIQKAMSDSHLAIYNERNLINGLRLQYEDLRKTEREDMRRLNELKALNDDLKKQRSQANAPVRDCRPDSSKKMHPMSKRERDFMASSKPAVTPAAK